MSDTDDTDILVQIPPNLFHVHTSTSDDSFNIDSTRTVVRRTPKPKSKVINDLVTHVSNLEFRIENLEVNSNATRNCSVADSCFVHSLSPRRISETTEYDHSSYSKQESKCFTFPRRKRRKQVKKSSIEFSNSRGSTLCDSFNYKYDNLKDYYPVIPNVNASTEHSLKSNSDFNLKLQSLNSDESHTMEGDISSIASSPEKKTDKYVLKEIDMFLDKVEMYESSMSMQDSRNTEPTHDRISAPTSFSQKLKEEIFNPDNNEVRLPSGRTVSGDFFDKYRYLKDRENEDPKKTEPFHYLQKKYETNSQKLLSDDSSGYQQIQCTPTKDSFKVPFDKDGPQSNVNRKLEFVASEPGTKFHPTSTPKQPLPNKVLQDSLTGRNSFKPSCNRLSERATNIIENKKSDTGSVNHFLESDVSMQKETPVKKEQSSDCRAKEMTNRVPSYTSRLSSVQEGQRCSLEHDSKDSKRNVYPISTNNSNRPLPETIKIENIYQKFRNLDESRISSVDMRGAEFPDINLISLSDLWGNHGIITDGKFNNRKLEEEKLKRKHCEDIIQQLQKKLLEQQEKLAVAVRVDAAKDVAVGKLRASWLRIQQHLNDAEGRHKDMLERMTSEITNWRTKTTEAEQKSQQYEGELHKALDLAHGYQEKYKEVSIQRLNEQAEHEKDLGQLKEENESKCQEIEDLRENNTAVMRLNKQFTDCIQKLEDTIEKEKNAHDSTKVQLTTTSTALECSKNEMTILLSERDTLREKVREEQARSAALAQKLGDTQERVASANKREESFETEVSTLRKQIEVQKNDLKMYYQKQLEEAVLAKLREFQGQLDAAERQMEQEMRDKEQNIAEGFARRLYKVEEQHKLEISLLEEKQGEESKLHRLQLAQAADKISTLENKLDLFRSRRGQIASQLHHVMESQWRQALHILTHQGSSPDVSTTLADFDNKMGNFSRTKPSLNYPTLQSHDSAVASNQRQERRQSNVEPLLSDAELQHYVKMLLTKPPSIMDSSAESVRPQHREPTAYIEEPTSDRTRPNREPNYTDHAGPNQDANYIDRAGLNRDPNYIDRAGSNREQNHQRSNHDQIYTDRARTSNYNEPNYTDHGKNNNEQGTNYQEKGKNQNKSRDSISYSTGKPPWKC